MITLLFAQLFEHRPTAVEWIGAGIFTLLLLYLTIRDKKAGGSGKPKNGK
jgi:hypothetical protein